MNKPDIARESIVRQDVNGNSMTLEQISYTKVQSVYTVDLAYWYIDDTFYVS